MATDLFLPLEVTTAIGKRIRQAELAAIADFPQTSKDEDTIVESFGSKLRCRQQIVEVSSSNRQELPGPWRWSISHTRFRGRGPGALEKKVGADVIIQLNLRTGNRYLFDSKSLLVQAKKNWTVDGKVFDQAARLLTWREASSVINLTPQRFEAFSIDDVINGKGKRPTSFKPLSEFLRSEFVSGELGDASIDYDSRHEWLQWLDMNGILVRCTFPCKQKISINVSTPPSGKNPAAIKVEEIPDHRLKATPSQILGVSRVSDLKEFKKAYRRMQNIYHEDKHPTASKLAKDQLKRQSQEINRAFGEVKD